MKREQSKVSQSHDFPYPTLKSIKVKITSLLKYRISLIHYSLNIQHVNSKLKMAALQGLFVHRTCNSSFEISRKVNFYCRIFFF